MRGDISLALSSSHTGGRELASHDQSAVTNERSVVRRVSWSEGVRRRRRTPSAPINSGTEGFVPLSLVGSSLGDAIPLDSPGVLLGIPYVEGSMVGGESSRRSSMQNAWTPYLL